MTDNYTKLVQINLAQLYENNLDDLAFNLSAVRKGDTLIFQAFGKKCSISPTGITLSETDPNPVVNVIISLYALTSQPDICLTAPFKAFKELPNSMPYIGAFTTHTEQILVPYVPVIKDSVGEIINTFSGSEAPSDIGGDFAFIVYPLPKIALCYVFYEADEEFSASVTCLFSNNANIFIPIDGLADVGEYSSKAIIEIVK